MKGGLSISLCRSPSYQCFTELIHGHFLSPRPRPFALSVCVCRSDATTTGRQHWNALPGEIILLSGNADRQLPPLSPATHSVCGDQVRLEVRLKPSHGTAGVELIVTGMYIYRFIFVQLLSFYTSRENCS